MKNKICIAIFVLACVAVVFALTSGPRTPGAGANNAGAGSLAWANTGNVTAADSNGSNASSMTSVNGPSQLLQTTSYGFTIPTSATINGFTVVVARGMTGTNIWDNSLKLMKAGTAVGTDHADTATIWPLITACPGTATGYGTATYGSGSDLWGATWAASDVNASNFGVQIQAQNKNLSSSSACVDTIQVTVTFTPGAGGSLLKIFSHNDPPKPETQTRTFALLR